MKNIYYYINGKFIDSKKASIPFNDAGFLYGDGLFETMRFDSRVIFNSDSHLKRLLNGLEIINLNIDYSISEILKLLYSVLDKNNLDSGIIRLMITRGPIDNKTTNKASPSIFISIKPFYDIPSQPIKIIYLDETKFPIIRFTPAIKSMNYIGNMLAKKESSRLGAFEPVFYNSDRIITECAIRNIFYIKNNVVLTPNLNLGILAGIMRDTIISIALHLNLKVEQTHISYNEIKNMDEAFISSTGIGLLECYWEGWSSEYFITKQIKKELFNRIKNN